MPRSEVPSGCSPLTMFVYGQAEFQFYVVAVWETTSPATCSITESISDQAGLYGSIYGGLEELTWRMASDRGNVQALTWF